MAERPFLHTHTGARLTWLPDDNGGGTVISRTDVAPILERNKAMANHNDGYSPTRELRRAASIPFALIHKWLTEEGWNALDPANEDKLKAKLNSNEYLYLRTAPGKL